MFIIAELTDEAVAILKDAGHDVKIFVTTEADKALVFLKQAAENEPLVTRALNLVSDLESKTMTGPEKMAKLVGDVTGEVETALAEGGFGHLVSLATTLAHGLGEMVLADFRAALAKV